MYLMTFFLDSHSAEDLALNLGVLRKSYALVTKDYQSKGRAKTRLEPSSSLSY